MSLITFFLVQAVNPVAMGKTRAKQMDLLNFETDCKLGDRVMCIQLHGDAVSKT
jgi:probable 2-oxoglutarate dehydrogenase E1 component DHKTD1